MSRFRFIFLLALLFILPTSCSTNTCKETNGKVLQVYTTANEVVRNYQVDHGASGYSVTPIIFGIRDNRLLEEIGLRGDDCLPITDSTGCTTIHLLSSFPVGEKPLDFQNFCTWQGFAFPRKIAVHIDN